MKRREEEARIRQEVLDSKEVHSKVVRDMVGEEEAPKETAPE